MPRFFFDIHDGEDFTPDREGLDLDDLEAAKDEARKALRDIIWDEMPDWGPARLYRRCQERGRTDRLAGHAVAGRGKPLPRLNSKHLTESHEFPIAH